MLLEKVLRCSHFFFPYRLLPCRISDVPGHAYDGCVGFVGPGPCLGVKNERFMELKSRRAGDSNHSSVKTALAL